MGEIDDDGIEQALREHLASDAVPADVVDRARSAFANRATRSRLVPLEHDVAERAGDSWRRSLTFVSDQVRIVLELAGTGPHRHLHGSVTPGRVRAAFLRSEHAVMEIAIADGRFESDYEASQVSVLVDVEIDGNAVTSFHTDWFSA